MPLGFKKVAFPRWQVKKDNFGGSVERGFEYSVLRADGVERLVTDRAAVALADLNELLRAFRKTDLMRIRRAITKTVEAPIRPSKRDITVPS